VQKIILTTIIICVFTIARSQDKATVKLEVAGGYGNLGGNFFPKLLVPVTKHFDVGFAFLNAKFNEPYLSKAQLSYHLSSLEFRYNLSNVHRKVNPHIGYLLSMSSAKLDREDASNDEFVMALARESNKSRLVHGFNVGFDIRLNAFISFITQFQVYSLSKKFIYSTQYHYDNANGKNVFDNLVYGNQVDMMAGLQIKIFSQKSFIR